MGGAPSRILDAPALYLGGVDAFKDESFFTRHGISAILSVGDEAPPVDWTHIERRLQVKKRDSPDASLEVHFAEAVAFVHDARCSGRGVYIHCHAGISRSSTCCAAYLMAHLSMPLLDAMGHLLRCRDTVCPNPGFREQLGHFETTGASDVRAALRGAHGVALVGSDLRQVAELLVQSQSAVVAQAASEWVYASNGKPVDAQTLATLADDQDGNGPYVRVHEEDDDPKSLGRRRSVRRAAELLAEAESDWRDGFDVPLHCLGFEAQVERLRARLQPLVDAGEAAPGGVAGLEWLASAAAADRAERDADEVSAEAARMLEAAAETDAEIAEMLASH